MSAKASFPPAPGLRANDPERATADATWLRGITPARVAILVAVCAMLALRNSARAFSFQEFLTASGYFLEIAARNFACAVPMFILVVKTDIRTSRSPSHTRIVALAAAVIAGALAYVAVRWGIRSLIGTVDPETYWRYAIEHFTRALATGGFLTAILYFAARERDIQRALHRLRLSRIEVEQQTVESRLQLLQAQIEPHFLFNSLASVKRLYEREPGKGRALLRNLGDYLRVATSHARQCETRLDGELALARSFLEIFQVRMGERLSVSIDLPDGLESALIPPLMIGTLVENAIKHGIAPRGSGGSLGIAARCQGEMLEVAVRDDGVGFRSRSGSGVGLANVRARLETQFGDAGTLDVAANSEGGVSATLRLPCRFAPCPAGVR